MRKVSLGASKKSEIVTMGHCPQTFENTCGINYRSN
jgi:hypothetical protein